MDRVRVDFDPEVQAWYLTLADSVVARTESLSDDVSVDLDAAGEVVGAEFLVAPAAVEPEVRRAIFERFPAIKTALADLHTSMA